jgi:lipopolysaccharide biosynthesis glycosyltransferase
MKKVILTTFSDSKYFDLLKELISSIKKFSDSSKVSIGVLDGGLTDDQIKYLKQHVNHIKKANWDIPVNKIRVRGRDYLKNHVCRAFLPEYFTGYDKYIWLDCDTWLNDWKAIDYLIEGCKNGKLAVVQTIAPGYRDVGRVKWLFKNVALVKTQNFKHAISSGFPREIANKIAFAPNINAGVFSLEKNSNFWISWRKLLSKAINKGRIFSSEQLAMNIAVYYENQPVEFLPPTCNWILDHLLPYYDENKKKFVEPFLPNNSIGIMHLASKIKGDNSKMKSKEDTYYQIKSLNNKFIRKNLRFVE